MDPISKPNAEQIQKLEQMRHDLAVLRLEIADVMLGLVPPQALREHTATFAQLVEQTFPR